MHERGQARSADAASVTTRVEGLYSMMLRPNRQLRGGPLSVQACRRAPTTRGVRGREEHLTSRPQSLLTHLQRLEAESIHIMREVVAECDNPVMLYSIGKDSAVMLHLAAKAFHPSRPPFPLLHVDTTWKFKAMYAHRDGYARSLGFDLIVHINEEGLAKDVGPFTSGSAVHTDVM